MTFFTRFSKAKVVKDALAVDLLLHAHSGDCQHCKPPIAQLPILHLCELICIRRLQTKRIEAKVARVVSFPQSKQRPLRRVHPALVRPERLSEVDGEDPC